MNRKLSSGELTLVTMLAIIGILAAGAVLCKHDDEHKNKGKKK